MIRYLDHWATSAPVTLGTYDVVERWQSECGVEQTPTHPESDWLESEVIAGFRVWQILFLVCAGMSTLVIVACCVTRWRIPHTRQEIEANHRRNQITQLFRCHLDRLTVDEVDLLWALDKVKAMAERRKSRKRASEDKDETEEEAPLKPLSLMQRVKGVFVKKPLVEFSDDESNQLSSSLENCSL
ncbi:uncharacterized protein TNIN_244621 [Trichonephila inaurata madagascariensis]|uniref:Transmembrane inner ear expressed protein n=1 Tax=Trichonephila inaurata madagascariensis TaxID=2747483 RepID=A0A8X6Y3T9_9ARAC|nr:uncharacterized protein TNIN_244621 [Trichonephila inaurata madagascariensis]